MTELTRGQQELADQIKTQRQRIQWSLTQTQTYLQTIDMMLRDLPLQVQQLRHAQHPYDLDLEEIFPLVEHWQQRRGAIRHQVEEGGGRLESTYRMVQGFDLSSSQWLTEPQILAQLQGELRDLEDILAQTLRWQKQVLAELSPFTQKATALSRTVKTRQGARDFLQTATFLCDPPEVPMGAFAVICPHWGPSEQVPAYLFISDARILLESQQTEEKRGLTRFGTYERAWDRKLLQQWPIAALTQIEQTQSQSDPASETSSDPVQTVVTLRFDESYPDVIVEQLQVACEAREAVNLVDTLYRAQHPQGSQMSQSSAAAEPKPAVGSTQTSGSASATPGLTPVEIEQKLQKIEDALLEGRISEQTYRELKQKYEGLAASSG